VSTYGTWNGAESIRGETMAVIIPVGSTVALVDEDDEALVSLHTWCVNSDGSATTNGSISMHRLIMQAQKGYDVSHRDGNMLNNQRANLLVVPRSVTTHRAERRVGRAGYKGVSYDKQRAGQQRPCWRAQVMKDSHRYASSWYWTPEEAAEWYNHKARDLFGALAYQNEIPARAL
jgi:hypothetical protein